MCRLPTLNADFYPLFDDDLEEASPFDSSLVDVGFESDIEIFSDDPSSFPVGSQLVKQENINAYLGQGLGSTLPDGLLAVSKDPSVLGLPMGTKLVTPGEQPTDLNGDLQPLPLGSSQFVPYMDACGGAATLGAPAWGFCNFGNVNALGMGVESAQMQSKRLQQEMAMRASVGSTPVSGHGKRSKEEVAAQVERVKKRRRESAQRSRQRKNEYMKNLEEENRALKYELSKLRQWMNRLQKNAAALSPSQSASLSHGSNHTNM